MALEHFFVLLLENRSFDHVFGFSGIKGADAVTGKPTTVQGVDPALQHNQDPATGKHCQMCN
jgi:phospholipase C